MSRLRKLKYSVDFDYFSIPSIQNSYWAGFIAADGCIDKNTGALRIKLKESDRDHLEQFCRDTSYTGKIYSCSSTIKGKTYSQVQICITTYKKWAIDLYTHWNITPTKSLTLQPPSIVDPDLIKSFIIGYFDGDGNITRILRGEFVSKHLAFSGTKEILEWIKKYCEEWYPGMSHKGCKVIKAKQGNWYIYRINGNRVEQMVVDLMRYTISRLSRKWDDNKIPICKINQFIN